MNIDYEYLSRIRRAVALYTTKKTSNILEGDFHSIHKGRSMDFEDLKEYTPGDEVHDIDWKSSSRMGTILVRRYMTDRRHNMMFVCDSGLKMKGDTPCGDSKKEIALMTFGTLAYIAGRNGSDFAMAYSKADQPSVSLFKSGPDHLEGLLYEYEKHICEDNQRTISQTLMDVVSMVHKRMIIVLITDMEGLAGISKDTVRAITKDHDLLAFGIEDASLFGENVYDLESSRYERFFFSHSRKLKEYDKELRKELGDQVHDTCKQSRVAAVSLKAESEIIDKAIVLFERYRHGNYGYITTTL
ncbi:MAG: DUF58 domain-containing protein [Butyrivibrio sp.]|nr:DUF58 domain-containing protein [Butyrivibrio sp.]